jgi:hypothetical protein
MYSNKELCEQIFQFPSTHIPRKVDLHGGHCLPLSRGAFQPSPVELGQSAKAIMKVNTLKAFNL